MSKVIDVIGVSTFVAGINKFRRNWCDPGVKVQGIIKGLVVEVFKELMLNTPEYSGDLVANWNISVDTPDYSYDPGIVEDIWGKKPGGKFDVVNATFLNDPFDLSSRNIVAISAAKSRAKGSLSRYLFLRQKIYISNGAPQGRKVEMNSGDFLREVNLPGHMVDISVFNVNTRYSKLSKNDITDLISFGGAYT